VIAIAALDSLAVIALWAVFQLAQAALFAKAGGQTQLASVLLASLVAWRVYTLLFQIFLRPSQPAIRIAPVGDDSARRITRVLGVVIVIAVITQRTWLHLLITPAALHAAILTNSLVILTVLIYTTLRLRSDMAGWFTGLIGGGATKPGFKLAIAQHWHWIAVSLAIVLGLVRIYAALSNEFGAPSRTRVTLIIVVGLILAETLWSFITRSARRSADAAGASGFPLLPFLIRAARATIWVGATAALVRLWVVDVLALLDQASWSQYSHAWFTAIVTALVAYIAWDALYVATDAREKHGLAPGSEETPIGATRMETLAPFLRVIFGTFIFVTAGLVIIASLDISITPFIAGVSVIGLAISIGSQSLVLDIVSGLCYLAEDAFRVGEYIECGDAKGHVAGFTLRSLRLRHQNGQIHTIPFGQLGQVANFSRDWSTLRFNLRFDHDTDIEKLRMETKKVGLAMAEDPSLKDDIIEPLKLEGIDDIDDTATIMRFKITVRPNRPSFIQREAVERLAAAYKEAGIEFASAMVAVQTVGGAPVDGIAVAGAAASKAG
jgi:small-conductance mechanosensitive channel